MKRIILIVCFWVTSCSIAWACTCIHHYDFTTMEHIKGHAFIALVKITKLEAIPGDEKEIGIFSHRAHFNILSLFRGTPDSSVVISGGNYSLGGRTSSCDLGEEVGDEWILFAEKDPKTGELTTSFCSQTKRHRTNDGHQVKPYWDEPTVLEKLNGLFKKPRKVPLENGTHIGLYLNGVKEVKATYRRGRLHGVREWWYPNGNLERSERYKNGLKDGETRIFFKDGTLESVRYHKNGNPVKTAKVWHSTDTSAFRISMYRDINDGISVAEAKKILSARRLSLLIKYNNDGEQLYGAFYNSEGKLNYDSTHDIAHKRVIKRFYHTGGALSSESVFVNDKQVSNKEWDDTGFQTKEWFYDENGHEIKAKFKIFKKP